MRTAYLRPEHVADLPQLHAELARQLRFPAWYGGNLDALYDLLCEARTQIVLYEPEALREALGEDYDRLLCVLTDAGARVVSIVR